jgi:hypothetical protein
MTNPSRRALLRAGVVVAASVPLGAARQAMSFASTARPTGLRRALFRPHVGATFRFVADDGASYDATLTKVADTARAARGHDLRFRLLFQMHHAQPAQGTYRVEHPEAGAVLLFVSPVSGKAGVYEAVVHAR